MGLDDVDLQTAYRSGRDALIDEFYVPCLQEPVRYDRAVGYFSSTLYQVVGLAFSDFVRRGGRMRLDLLASTVARGLRDHEDGRRDRPVTPRKPFAKTSNGCSPGPRRYQPPNCSPPSSRMASSRSGSRSPSIRAVIFHDKLGIFEDDAGRRVAFTGSANETWRAWGLNNESFQVFCSWTQ